jgi:hypothetical protein
LELKVLGVQLKEPTVPEVQAQVLQIAEPAVLKVQVEEDRN